MRGCLPAQTGAGCSGRSSWATRPEAAGAELARRLLAGGGDAILGEIDREGS